MFAHEKWCVLHLIEIIMSDKNYIITIETVHFSSNSKKKLQIFEMLRLEESQFVAGNVQRRADHLRKVNGQKEQLSTQIQAADSNLSAGDKTW